MPNTTKKTESAPMPRGAGQQVVQRLRKELYSALHLLDKKDRPLDRLLADQIERDPATTLNKLSFMLPKDVNLTGDASEFAQALGDVAARIAEQNAILRHAPLQEASDDAQIIDITPENSDDDQKLTEKASKK